MNIRNILFLTGLILLLLLSACTPSRQLISMENMDPSPLTPEELMELTPNYSEQLQSLSGSGRAIVSEPDGSERVTLQFHSNREKSLITIRTSVGIEGGQILVDSDSLLVYNRVDKIAEKVSLTQSNLTNIGSLASLNMLDMFNFTLEPDQIVRIYEDEEFYLALLRDHTEVSISKSEGLIQQVVQKGTNSAYSQIDYEGYAQINDFYLPRKITILSSDGRSQATFLVRRLEVNGNLPPMEISIPDNIPIRRI
ncbi:DUF4292 domain-containing protein [Rhodohalobacter halophilus]|uniref:DUF4292 domain-containing protein n=1 Tax=Rhodohalobacter halophilus TaxID=1812810 RepID=UPI00083FD597|nr:DUF4292 domain-containing protein [Rhodohalobacter halophilus]